MDVPARVPGQAAEGRRGQGGDPRRGRRPGTARPARAAPPFVVDRVGTSRAAAQPAAAVHHQPAPAGGRPAPRLHRQEDDDLAQRLYEGVDLGEGQVGLITYMRTDSPRVVARGPGRGAGASSAASTARPTCPTSRTSTAPARRARSRTPTSASGRPPSLRRPDQVRGVTRARPGPAVRADLVALRGQPDDPGRLPRHRGRHPGRRLPLPGHRLAPLLRRPPAGLRRPGRGRGRARGEGGGRGLAAGRRSCRRWRRGTGPSCASCCPSSTSRSRRRATPRPR